MSKFWSSVVNTETKPLTREDLERGIKLLSNQEDNYAKFRAEKAKAWAELHLDYDAMTIDEKYVLMLCQVQDAVHPNTYKKAQEIIDKYRT